MVYRECRASRGHTDPREGKVEKDKLVIKDHKECRVQEETEGEKGPLGRVVPEELKGMKGQKGLLGMKGEQGIAGMKGERGAVGMKGKRGIAGIKGRKGDKGDKGESAKASQASVVPQTNWKQCVWKSLSNTDNGKIKVNRIRIITHPYNHSFLFKLKKIFQRRMSSFSLTVCKHIT